MTTVNGFSKKTVSYKTNFFTSSVNLSRGSERNIFPAYVSLDLCFPLCDNEDKSFLVKEKALGVEGSWSNQWSR